MAIEPVNGVPCHFTEGPSSGGKQKLTFSLHYYFLASTKPFIRCSFHKYFKQIRYLNRMEACFCPTFWAKKSTMPNSTMHFLTLFLKEA